MNILTHALRAIRRHAGLKHLVLLAGAGAALATTIPSAQAVPSYARQTGSECASCHVGGFGPQLTPYGIRFKINGYTDTDGKEGKIPLSAMMVVNATRTAKDAPEADKVDHFNSNNNVAMQEASVFVAGKLADNIGSFVQVTYSGIDRTYSLDQADVRYARSLKLGDKEMTVGVSLNTNPTLTDPFNTLGQWRFPYTSSDFNPGFGPAVPKVESLGGGVMGVNAYAFYDDSLYAELGLYNNLSKKALNIFNTEDQGKFKGLGTYGRIAYFKDRKRDNFSFGLFGFSADIQDRADPGPSDKYRDLGLDASYQYLGNRKHIFTANASYVREWQRLNATLAGADDVRNTIDQFRAAGSYHYDQTWGGTVGLFDLRGKANNSLYTGNTDPDGVSGSPTGAFNGRPNTRGYILQADWTPWGKEGSWGNGWANVRLGIQYTGYNRFMGGSTYLDNDGNERRARDNNTTMLFLWTSI